MFGGRARVEVTPGLTYAEYARSGFFQLIAVALLTVLVILVVWDLGAGARDEPWFCRLVSAMVLLTGIILASAWMRLRLYESTFGFTVSRLVAYFVIAWIAVVLVIVLLAVRASARERVVPLAVVAGLLALLAMNAINPEAFVAQRNIDRWRATGKIDLFYLDSLGFDALPSALSLPAGLRGDAEADLRGYHCELAVELDAMGWRSANFGRARARAALERAGITPRTCARAP